MPPAPTDSDALVPDSRTLRDGSVILTALTPDLVPPLFAALDHEEVWASGYGGGPDGRPATASDLAAMVARWPTGEGQGATYAVLSGGEVVGTTSLGRISAADHGVEIGWTAYDPSVWGTGVNLRCKRLLLGHVFDDLAMERAQFRVDSLNVRSLRAVLALGAVQEGVLRHDRLRPDGIWRDSVTFSVLSDEWPTVRERIEERLARGLS